MKLQPNLSFSVRTGCDNLWKAQHRVWHPDTPTIANSPGLIEAARGLPISEAAHGPNLEQMCR